MLASIFIKQNNSGWSIKQLVDSISKKVGYEYELIEKLDSIIFKTLGNSLEHSIVIKFDYEIAKRSLQFYNHKDISKIEEIHIPNTISELRYKSDLTDIKPIEIFKIKDKQALFNAL